MLPVQRFILQEIIDEERRQRILQNNIARRIMRNDSDPFVLDDAQFIQTFRLTKDMVQYLMNALIPHMTESFHLNAVTPSIQIFAVLNFYATGSYQRAVGQNYMFSISQCSVCNYIHYVSTLIVEHLANIWIVFPTTINEKLRIKSRFMELSRFPGTIGGIDCTHVAILCPTDEEHNYFNRKGYHSKNVQIICDADLKILNINARYAGATHDAYIWRRSIIRQELDRCFQEGDQNSWLLGDSGYPQEPWLMTPVLNAGVGTPEERYSIRHTSTRSCIERCNAVLKTRFRCIMGERKLRYSPEKTSNIINACAVLHNICMEGRLPITNDIFVPNENEEVNGIGYGGNQHGRDTRQRLIE